MDDKTGLPITLPLKTIVTVLLVMLLVKTLGLITPLILPLMIGSLLAVALTPVVEWQVKKGMPRKVAIAALTVLLVIGLVGFLSAIAPIVYHQALSFFENLPQFREDLLSRIGAGNPLHSIINHALKQDVLGPKAEQINHLLGAGNLVLGGFTEVLLVFILSIYLIIDGPRIIEWVSAFFKSETQDKIYETGGEVSKIISAYVLGQFVTSILSFLFAFAALLLIGVPNALLLATLAGLLDVIPVLGFVIAVVPAMLFAASVSFLAPWLVLAAYLFYHGIENYVIVPLVYGKRMRVSSFVVFFTLLASGLIGGIEGALVALPIVASYPVIERIWLRKYVRKEALAEHAPS